MAIKHKYIWWDNKNKKSIFKIESITRSKAIRYKCIECCAFQKGEVRKCPAIDCALWPFRMGAGRVDHAVEKELANELKN